ncbi:DUF4870 domain-containing protein [Nocardia africana]|uniref:DUF4870 domain-containing protein n=1 Tax=Nocardia africana TaxID=134964 RepID=UPI00215D6587|nr:DUF4870 domain-containing protein [Nocardia africana]
MAGSASSPTFRRKSWCGKCTHVSAANRVGRPSRRGTCVRGEDSDDRESTARELPPPEPYPQSGGEQPGRSGEYPGHSGEYPQQPGQYAQQPGQYAQQPGQYPGGYPPPPAGGYPGPPGQGTWEQPKGKGLAITALVLGIIALLTCWTVLGGILFGLVALIFGIIATVKARRGTAAGAVWRWPVWSWDCSG